jgi:chemotaxis protein CheC
LSDFTPFQLDALRELGSISAGNAATAFSQMVSKKVAMTVPEVNLISFSKLKEMFQENEVKIGLYQKILGQTSGSILIIFSKDSAFELVKLVLHRSLDKPRVLRAEEEDLLKELANIVGGAYLTTLSKITNIFMMPSVPHLTLDSPYIMIEHLLQEKSPFHYAFVILSELKLEGSLVSFKLILLPDPDQLPLILSSLGIAK